MDRHISSPAPSQRVAKYSYTGIDIVELAHGDTITLQLRGELDLANAQLLTLAGDRASLFGCDLLVLDLSDLCFCDCAGLRAFVGLHNDLLRVRGTLVLRGVGRQVHRLLSLMRLDEVLNIDDGMAAPMRTLGLVR